MEAVTMKRLQGAEFQRMKKTLVATGYSITLKGNICVYYRGKYKHFLNDEEKKTFNPDGLKQFFPNDKQKKERLERFEKKKLSNLEGKQDE